MVDRAEEQRRVAALARYGVMDTGPERQFDDAVLLATRLCKTPVGLISLVTEDRQWFKARLGFAPHQTPLSQSVCAHAIKEDEILIIPDLTLDPRTRGNTLVTRDPFIRFYAGAVLRTAEGVAVGTLCVIDTAPRPSGLTDEQADCLKIVARQVVSQLELGAALDQSIEDRQSDADATRRETETLHRLLRDAPSFMAILRGPEHVFELVNDSYQQLIGHRDVIGMPMREALPDIAGQGFNKLLDQVYTTGKPFVGRGVPIELQPEPDGPVIQAFVNILCQPIAGETGAVTGIFVEGNDVTDSKRAEIALRDSDLKARIAMDAAQIGVWECVIEGSNFVDLVGDRRALDMLGGETGRAASFGEFMSRIDPDQRATTVAAARDVLTSEDGILDVEYRLQATAQRPERWIHARAQIDDAPGRRRLVGTVRDITPRKQAEAQQRLLSGELQHRIKNILAMVSSVAQQTLRGEDIVERRRDFSGRLEALSHAHDILTASSWSAASVEAVIEGALRPQGTLTRFDISGPPVMLNPRQGLSLALTIHELATNAAKYGALSLETGRVAISWTIEKSDEDVPLFRFVWQERGGPIVAEPQRVGFGSRMITKVLAGDFNGKVSIQYQPEGVTCILVAPRSDLGTNS